MSGDFLCLNFMKIKLKKWLPEYTPILKELCEKGATKYEDMSPYFPSVSKFTIAKKAQEFGFVNKFKYNKYYYDYKKLIDESLDLYYWFGWLFADGCILKNTEKSVGLHWQCSSIDEEYLYKFKDWIKGEMPIKRVFVSNDKYKTKIGGWHSKIYFSISEIYPQIKSKFGDLESKLYRGSPPATTEIEKKIAFICGYINGDGCISVHKKKKTLTIGFVSSAPAILEWILSFVNELNLPNALHPNQKTKINITSPSYTKAKRLRFNGVKAIYLYEILKCCPIPIMTRKWENPEVIECIAYNKGKYPERFVQPIDSILTRNNIDFSKTF